MAEKNFLDDAKAKFVAQPDSMRYNIVAAAAGLFLVVFLLLPQLSADAFIFKLNFSGWNMLFGYSVGGETATIATFATILAFLSVICAIATGALHYVLKNEPKIKEYKFYAAIAAVAFYFLAVIFGATTGDGAKVLDVNYIGLILTLIFGAIMIVIAKTHNEIK